MDDVIEKNNSARWWMVSALVVVVVVAVVTTVLLRDGGEDQEPSLAQPQEVTDPESTPEPSTATDGGDPTVTSDVLGRRVVDYGTGQGKPLSGEANGSTDLCSDQEQRRAPEGLEIQRTQGVMTVWSVSDGPADTTNAGLPSTYSHTPAGAALAAWNTQALLGSDDMTAVDVLENNFAWSSEQKDALAAAKQQFSAGDYSDTPRNGADFLPVPEAFQVVSCADDLMVIELAQPRVADESGPTDQFWDVYRLPMIWLDGEWLVNGADQNSPVRESINELGGEWSRWEF